MTPEQTTALAVPVRTAVPRELPAAAPEDFTFGRGAEHVTGRDVTVVPAVPLAPLWSATTLGVLVLSAFFALTVSGRVVTEGPVVLVLTRTHGIHLGDLLALAAWCLAVGALVGAALVTTVALRRR